MRTEDLNATWAGSLLDRLRGHGVHDVCIAPGSRSAPLALAAARRADRGDDLTLHTHFDERGLAFYALGLIRASRRPVAVITTSGTAAPNLHPAVAEARQSSLPLVVITADRPPELHHCGANQAMPQEDLFAPLVRAALALPPPEATLCGHWLNRRLDATLAEATGAGATGPIHLNVPLREPLYGGTEHPPVAPPLPPRRAPRAAAPPLGPAEPPQLFVAGGLNPEEAEAVLETAAAGNIPILADPSSQLRLRAHPCILGGAEHLLATAAGRAALGQARQVVQFGGRLTGRRLPAWLTEHAPQRWLITGDDHDLDPDWQATTVQADIATAARALRPAAPQPPLPGLTEALTRVAETRSAALANEPFAEPAATERLSRTLPPGMALFAGNSLPIRAVDLFAVAKHGNPCVTQRGVSGIDGLIATAAGFAHHHPDGVTLVIGDLSALHDLNSLALLDQARHTCVVVVLNNDGGGIFDLLPARSEGDDAHRRLFRMPHGYGFSQAAAQFRLPYWQCTDGDSLEAAHREACTRPGGSVIEVACPPGAGSEQMANLFRTLEAL
ncbi:2-succinyl-5-enolpyruvyl-6-hydroxy-3-cyclohexene-1-carboxylic-acid synthase [Halorhodospira halophila]|uniref:2-succinyl-5-enolpyruvyl-6-hydroxy-3-cyclohexene-1-carboxylate synthase n=1 Tax=Halorhodospira halophila (strain DSM 244 / SL1) TaxID=349124 RepID=MEND_HALHL|nr:2-succinyl-5-enolpyruvyl-6-hydroxy-3-cyclohexene-1-carboxylic-acid synthase [Halorhodospira halophila]A1WW41.1 RecName: Full=2-succinyl-5-enolpyruvyl-6-hydroxy-3-cyclohexene-1-carboxylate synthase; Short=SEPHCHC synthase; AltName: Full=Menaquinone biosynthesis protein MenD [Halorhodospira halophila SL1]ABM61903.1 2-succinyl-6-hydroxy-2,4-cyclohexadiene-1-carboxylate synthase [Halorhodospira halophila SL1]MBK1729889.1 2-succinyl-5-enolpyruvyl-6-hydroxy-3-cyclohexene-1-carboxylate synthase [Hal